MTESQTWRSDHSPSVKGRPHVSQASSCCAPGSVSTCALFLLAHLLDFFLEASLSPSLSVAQASTHVPWKSCFASVRRRAPRQAAAGLSRCQCWRSTRRRCMTFYELPPRLGTRKDHCFPPRHHTSSLLRLPSMIPTKNSAISSRFQPMRGTRPCVVSTYMV